MCQYFEDIQYRSLQIPINCLRKNELFLNTVKEIYSFAFWIGVSKFLVASVSYPPLAKIPNETLNVLIPGKLGGESPFVVESPIKVPQVMFEHSAPVEILQAWKPVPLFKPFSDVIAEL